MYTACLQTIQTYAQWNTNRLSLAKASEEETFRDIFLLLKLLINLLSKDYLDLCTSRKYFIVFQCFFFFLQIFVNLS